MPVCRAMHLYLATMQKDLSLIPSKLASYSLFQFCSLRSPGAGTFPILATDTEGSCFAPTLPQNPEISSLQTATQLSSPATHKIWFLILHSSVPEHIPIYLYLNSEFYLLETSISKYRGMPTSLALGKMQMGGWFPAGMGSREMDGQGDGWLETER